MTTAVEDMARNKRVIAGNKVVLELADENNLSVIDLYSITDANRELISDDGVHLSSAGYEIPVNQIVKTVCEKLNIN